MDPGVRATKAWKAEHKLGSIQIAPGRILGPLDVFRARLFSMPHCVILKKKLFTTGSRNSKGVKLVVFNHALEQEWLKASPEQRREMFAPGADYHGRVMVQPMYAIGGDHTRTAVAELHEEYPAQEKWAMFKDVTLLVSGESLECCSMLRDLGVMYNSKQYHKDMGFADRMMLTRKYYADMGMLAKGMRRTGEVIAWCEKQCALAGIPVNSWSQYAACARVDAQSWVFMEAILKGQYAVKIGRGTVPATIPSFAVAVHSNYVVPPRDHQASPGAGLQWEDEHFRAQERCRELQGVCNGQRHAWEPQLCISYICLY